jgi:hypothetical protein
VAGVALVAVGGAALLPTGDPAPSSPERFDVAASATAPGPFTGDALLHELEKLLPAGGTFGKEQAQGTDAKAGPYAQLVYDDGHGAAAISVWFGRVDAGSGQARELTDCPDSTFTRFDHCTTALLSDGSQLRLFQGYEYPDRRVDTKYWAADLVTPRGQHISVGEWNSPAEKDAPISREDPPLSTAQLRKVATAGVWRKVVDAIPRHPETTLSGAAHDAPPEVPGAAIGKTLTELLPEKLRVVRRGGQDAGFAYVVVDDGKGRSLVQINVQHGMNDDADQLYGSAETLPDGTLLVTQKGSGDKGVPGAVMWTVDTLRPGSDGFRVVISAFNGATQEAEPSRGTPALTMKQLREIALSPEWEKLR